jgi:hypothetical protein
MKKLFITLCLILGLSFTAYGQLDLHQRDSLQAGDTTQIYTLNTDYEYLLLNLLGTDATDVDSIAAFVNYDGSDTNFTAMQVKSLDDWETVITNMGNTTEGLAKTFFFLNPAIHRLKLVLCNANYEADRIIYFYLIGIQKP